MAEKIYLVNDTQQIQWFAKKGKTAILIDNIDNEIETLKEKVVQFKPKNEEQKKQVYDKLKGTVEALLIKIDNEIYHDLLKHYIYPIVGTKKVKDDIEYFPLKVRENFEALLKSKGIEIKYNLLSKEWEHNLNVSDRNTALTKLNTVLQMNGLNLGKDLRTEFTRATARINSYNPARDYLLRCEKNWDKKSRIKELYNTVVCEDYFDNEWKETLIGKWLVNAVRIAFNDGSYTKGTEGILIFKGDQGIGKTRWIASIMPNQKWHLSGADLNPNKVDSIHTVTRYWIVEYGEFERTAKHEQGELKAFIDRATDEYRLPYDAESISYPRLMIAYASVNEDEFLKDTTGNRRYWSIPCKEINADHNIDLNQLWGEVMYLWRSGKISHYLSEEEKERLNESNNEFEVETLTCSKIKTIFDWEQPSENWVKWTPSELAALLGITARLVKGDLKKLGIEQQRTTKDGRFYLLPQLKDSEQEKKPWSTYSNKKNTADYETIKIDDMDECPF